jgi:hypothetical protein
MTDDAIRIAMWSGPRNLSTAMMRSWGQRSDTVVMDEPLYAAYLATTGLDHPGAAEVMAAGPTDPGEAIAACLAPLPDGRTVSYQKHMAHHLWGDLLPDWDEPWWAHLRHGMLLRDPRRVLASYTDVREQVTLADIGLPQQLQLVDRCEVVIDTADFLTAPAAYLELMCDRLGVRYDPAMLSWPAGRRDTDGVWAPHWYSSVEASTGFGPAPHGPSPTAPAHLRALTADAMEIYGELRRHTVVLS